ncbi:hypothetical protein R6G53_001185 [Citrobacter freundii]|nr:hypothetical protein [Citrobacter freundii]
MTFDEYMQKTRDINEQLQEISTLTANQALAKCADSSNPQFVALMRRQAELTRRSFKLTEEMMEQLAIKQ